MTDLQTEELDVTVTLASVRKSTVRGSTSEMEPENRLREESSRGAVCSLVTGGFLTQSLWVVASESVLDAPTELVLLLSPQFCILPRDPEVMKATGLPFFRLLGKAILSLKLCSDRSGEHAWLWSKKPLG